MSLLLIFQKEISGSYIVDFEQGNTGGQDLKKFSVIVHFAFDRVWFNRFSANVPLTYKQGSWFLLAKCLKNTCGRVIL